VAKLNKGADMLTTKQVRAIIAQHSTDIYGVYTNKTKGHKGQERRVKCYFQNNVVLYHALQKAAGADNVTLTAGSAGYYSTGPGIVVKCVLG
jgi:hypothetical protein